jgi:hypothetical protein
MNRQTTGPASAKATPEAPGDTRKASKDAKGCGTDDFKPKTDLPGKTDSGPEPDVFGKEIPPQD